MTILSYRNNYEQRRLSETRERLANLIARFSNGGERFETEVPNMSIFSIKKPESPTYLLYEPGLCIAAQGAKRVTLSGHSYVYDRNHYLITSVNLPTMAQVIDASEKSPYLGFKLNLPPRELARVMLEYKPSSDSKSCPDRGIALGLLDFPLADAACRLVSLLESPEDIPMLSPLIQKEIIYRLLSGPQGDSLRQFFISGNPANRITESIAWLRENFTSRVSIGDLAAKAKMSVSAFHKHFRKMTAMSPVQYRKILQLQEAKRLMIAENMDVASAAYTVGYESATQFGREYKRLFGNSPRRDILQASAQP